MLRNVSVLQRWNLLDAHCLVPIVTKQYDVTDVCETYVLYISIFNFWTHETIGPEKLLFLVSDGHQRISNKNIQFKKL